MHLIGSVKAVIEVCEAVCRNMSRMLGMLFTVNCEGVMRMKVNTAYVCWNGCELLSLRKHTVAGMPRPLY